MSGKFDSRKSGQTLNPKPLNPLNATPKSSSELLQLQRCHRLGASLPVPRLCNKCSREPSLIRPARNSLDYGGMKTRTLNPKNSAAARSPSMICDDFRVQGDSVHQPQKLRYISRIKVSSYLATPSCGGRGVPRSPFYVAWLAEEFIHRNKIILLL